jgi:nucleoside-diphosphate-sugar epimerase
MIRESPDDTMAMRVLVTGAFGWTAKTILQALNQAGHEVISFDLPALLGYSAHIDLLSSEVIFGSVTDRGAMQQAIRGVDAIIHLATATGEDDYETPDIPFATNVQGTYNVFEAARQQGVSKIILMSEAAVHVPDSDEESQRLLDFLQALADDPREHLYDLTKRLQETIAHDYGTTYEMDVVTLRAGYIVDGRAGVDAHGRPLEELDYLRGGWVCRYDLADAVLRALELNLPGYHAYHVIGSHEARRRFEIERTERELGMTINERFEQYPVLDL